MELQEIERILKESLNVDEVYAQGENAHFGVIVVSDEISALSKLKQQQTIYAPLMPYFQTGEIHALTILNTRLSLSLADLPMSFFYSL